MTDSSMLDISELGTDESIPLDSSLLEETPASAPKKRAGKAKDAAGSAVTPKPAKTPKTPKATPPPLPDVATLLGRHSDTYQRVNGSQYMVALGKDSKAAQSLLKTYGLDKCLELNDAFFKSDDPLIKSLGHEFSVFRGIVHKLVVQAPTGQASQMMDIGELS